MTVVSLPLFLELKDQTPADALSRLLREFGYQSSYDHKYGETNYRLMNVIGDLVELIGCYPELALYIDDKVWYALHTHAARPIFYRQLYLHGGAEINWRERLRHLAIGTELLGVNPNIVLKETPRPPAESHSYCLA